MAAQIDPQMLNTPEGAGLAAAIRAAESKATGQGAPAAPVASPSADPAPRPAQMWARSPSVWERVLDWMTEEAPEAVSPQASVRRPWALYAGAALAVALVFAVPLDLVFFRPQPTPPACTLGAGSCDVAPAPVPHVIIPPASSTVATAPSVDPTQQTAPTAPRVSATTTPAASTTAPAPSHTQDAMPPTGPRTVPAPTTSAAPPAQQGGGTLVSVPPGAPVVSRDPAGGGTISETFPAQSATGSGLPWFVRGDECLRHVGC